MAQAKTLTEKELKRVLTFISVQKHPARNRAMLLITHWSGMRVGEVAALLVSDVVAADGTIKSEIRLLPEQTKGHQARTVFIGERLRKELAVYMATQKNVSQDKHLLALCRFVWKLTSGGMQGNAEIQRHGGAQRIGR